MCCSELCPQNIPKLDFPFPVYSQGLVEFPLFKSIAGRSQGKSLFLGPFSKTCAFSTVFKVYIDMTSLKTIMKKTLEEVE